MFENQKSKTKKRIREIEKELLTLSNSENLIQKNSYESDPFKENGKISFEDLFNIEEIQRIQNEFATAFGVASIITKPDGTPITSPSNFCRLCSDIIRKTEKGLENCFKSDALIGKYNPEGPRIQPCMSGGLWDAGAGISVGGNHIANWLIGQVRDETQKEESIVEYARYIGADEKEALEAFLEVTAMSRSKFEQIAKVLFTIANHLSTMAYQNRQQMMLISEIKNTQSLLEESEQKYRDIFNATSDAIFIHDCKTGVILDVNESMLQMFGYKKEEVLGSTIGKFSGDFFDEKTGIEKVLEAARKRKGNIFEWESKKRSGELFWVEVNVSLSIVGEKERMIAVVRDITQRKRTYELLIQNEKMMSIGGLSAGMAHEINNPISIILQNANVISNRLNRKDIPGNIKAAEEVGVPFEKISSFMKKRDIFRILQSINDSSYRVNDIVKNMLSFARKEETALSSHNAADIMDKTIELSSTDFDFRRVEIKKEYENENLPMILCEKGNIQQVFFNILKNGYYAMTNSPGPSPPQFIIRMKDEDNMLRIEIEDNGPGMDENTRKRILEPFFTTKPEGEGTGLGLSVAYFIVTDNHKGKMSVSSAEGKGTTFYIDLPL